MTEPDQMTNTASQSSQQRPRGTGDDTFYATLTILAIGAWCAGLLAGSSLFSIHDWRIGRAGLAITSGAAVLIALTQLPQTRRLPHPASAAIAVVAGLAFCAWASSYLSPGYYALRHEFRQIQNPPGWTSTLETSTGNSICFDVCISFSRQLVPNTLDPTAAKNAMTTTLQRQGYSVISDSEHSGLVFRRGPFEVTYSHYDSDSAQQADEIPPTQWELTIQRRTPAELDAGRRDEHLRRAALVTSQASRQTASETKRFRARWRPSDGIGHPSTRAVRVGEEHRDLGVVGDFAWAKLALLRSPVSPLPWTSATPHDPRLGLLNAVADSTCFDDSARGQGPVR